MNRKWFGSPVGIYLILVIFSPLLLSCTKDIPGNPKKTVENYIAAVQKSDFETIYNLNRVTARQKKYIKKAKNGNVEQELKASFETHKRAYEAVEPGFFTGTQWAGKFFFPPTATVVVGEARHPPRSGVDYEKGFTLYIEVKTSYAKREDAPELHGRKVKEAVYDCVLGKIRYGENVRVYSHDEQWFFAGCIIDTPSARFFDPKKPEQ